MCPLAGDCVAYAGGNPGSYPRRAAKVAKPERTAITWWVEREGQVLLVRRPAKGLLGGMMALPSTLADAGADFSGIPLGTVVHVFTHFRLTLTVASAFPDPGCVLPPDAQWWPVTKLADAGLPTLFAKAAAVAMRERV